MLNVDIIDYMGKLDNGVLVLISIGFNNNWYEATVYYTEDDVVITTDDSFEEDFGMSIEKYENYDKFLESVFKKLVPCSEIISRLDDVDFNKYMDVEQNTKIVSQEINPFLIKEIPKK